MLQTPSIKLIEYGGAGGGILLPTERPRQQLTLSQTISRLFFSGAVSPSSYPLLCIQRLCLPPQNVSLSLAVAPQHVHRNGVLLQHPVNNALHVLTRLLLSVTPGTLADEPAKTGQQD